MTTLTTRPTCSHCGRRITLFECLWRELPSGEARPSYAVDLQGIQRGSARLWHVACFADERAERRSRMMALAA